MLERSRVGAKGQASGKEAAVDQRKVNPWTWQDQFGFSQAIEVSGAERVLYCAGQTSTDEQGNTVAGDMGAQAAKALDNLETVLDEAGLSLANVVRLNYYVTDMDRFFEEAVQVVGERLGRAGIQPSSTLLGVTRLAFPDLLIELEATAVG
jgi:enamine deaminase RidA (YjgF/YER057c/UK114 family)